MAPHSMSNPLQVIKADWSLRPLVDESDVLVLFVYDMFLYMPFDVFVKPLASDHEIWFGIALHGWWAKATEPLHWLIYAAGARGFWKMKGWMWPWAALYSAQVTVAMLVWNVVNPNGQGLAVGGGQRHRVCDPDSRTVACPRLFRHECCRVGVRIRHYPGHRREMNTIRWRDGHRTTASRVAPEAQIIRTCDASARGAVRCGIIVAWRSHHQAELELHILCACNHYAALTIRQ